MVMPGRGFFLLRLIGTEGPSLLYAVLVYGVWVLDCIRVKQVKQKTPPEIKCISFQALPPRPEFPQRLDLPFLIE